MYTLYYCSQLAHSQKGIDSCGVDEAKLMSKSISLQCRGQVEHL